VKGPQLAFFANSSVGNFIEKDVFCSSKLVVVKNLIAVNVQTLAETEEISPIL
jgi:hypothetical protein